SDGVSLAVETGKHSDSHSAVPITATGGELIGLADAAAGLGIHPDSTFLDSVATKDTGLRQFAGTGYAGSGVTFTAPTPTADAGTVSTGANVITTSSSFLTASSSAIDPIFETRVATAGDDVEEKGSGAISTNVTDLELGYDGSTRQTVGMRFTGINIPKGAIITSAYIQFQANEVKTGATSLLIQGDKVDDASPFTTANFNVSALPRTAASTAWTPDPWTIVGEHGAAERTPDLSAVVQEIVNRSGWAALNDMAFLVSGTGTRTADSYEYNPATAPLLHIEYTLPGPAGSPVAFNTPPDANTLNDPRFAINSSTGVITRSATGTLDFETQSSINLTVTATSSDGSTANQAFTLAVLNSPEPVAFNNPPDANTPANQ
ncbi:MAG: cadherin repeat domain-containing protein, partial [Mesorhizobium sp.]